MPNSCRAFRMRAPINFAARRLGVAPLTGFNSPRVSDALLDFGVWLFLATLSPTVAFPLVIDVLRSSESAQTAISDPVSINPSLSTGAVGFGQLSAVRWEGAVGLALTASTAIGIAASTSTQLTKRRTDIPSR